VAGVPIRAVVFDIGGVLERVDDHSWPTTWARDWAGRVGMTLDELDAALAARPPIGDLLTGGASEADFRELYAGALGLDDQQADLMMAQMWDAYCGQLDDELFAWFAAQRGDYLLGILSNSSDGARREESRRHGIPDAADVVVYSHEVGLAKPDPAVYALTARLLGVAPEEIVFLDDSAPAVAGARDAGWHAVLHTDTRTSISEIERLLGRGAAHGADDVAASHP
jgi:putative hydrolase of the HAD superfamily